MKYYLPKHYKPGEGICFCNTIQGKYVYYKRVWRPVSRNRGRKLLQSVSNLRACKCIELTRGGRIIIEKYR